MINIDNEANRSCLSYLQGLGMGVRLYESSHFETLWAAFLQLSEADRSCPLQEHEVVVPGSGWKRYFSTHYADHTGCFSGIIFKTLGQWAHGCFGQLLDDTSERYDEKNMMWAIARIFYEREPGVYPLVDAYLQQAHNAPVKRLLALSRQMAHLFDRYHLYRPQIIECWNAGQAWMDADQVPDHAVWQFTLWQALLKDHRMPSYPEVITASAEEALNDLPVTHLWITSAMAPIYLSMIQRVGRANTLHVYVLRTFDEYMGGVVSARGMDWMLERGEQTELLEEMHPLASMGRRGIEMQMQVIDALEPIAVESPQFSEETESGIVPDLLRVLQEEVRHGVMPETSPLTLTEADRSLSIHSCHSPRREVQVLHDELRDAFEQDATLNPEDVLVVCPNLEEYAAHLDAVFRSNSNQKIPLHIAGRSPRRTSPYIEAFFRLLDLIESRLPRSRVLEMLSLEPVRIRLGLSHADCDLITDWINDAGVRWGSDVDHRFEMGLPGNEVHVWRYTFDRLLMGYACRPHLDSCFDEVAVLERVEGKAATLLGQVCDFVDRLSERRRMVQTETDALRWSILLTDILDEFMSSEGKHLHREMILEGMNALTDQINAGQWDQSLSYGIYKDELKRLVDLSMGGHGYRMGGVTVTDMTAMRSLPFRCIGILGMNDRGFPRADHPLSFDLMGLETQLGDRSLENEDRQLLLETLLQARDRVIITYQGQSLRDQTHRPACVMVEDIKDYLTLRLDEKTVNRLVLTHPLQPFSHQYFDAEQSGFRAYSEEQFQTAKALMHERNPMSALADEPYVRLANAQKNISIKHLQKLYTEPWALFLSSLEVWVDDWYTRLDDMDPLELNALKRWEIGDTLLQAYMAGQDESLARERLLKSGKLPSGDLGLNIYQKSEQAYQALIQNIERITGTREFMVQSVALPIQDYFIQGEINGVHEKGLLYCSFSNEESNHLPRLWINHLVRCAAGHQTPSVLVMKSTRKNATTFQPLSQVDAVALLTGLIELYEMACLQPLPFFHQSAKTYCKMLEQGYPAEAAVQSAVDVFYNQSRFKEGVHDKLDVRMAFRGIDPFAMRCDDQFKARAVEQSQFEYLAQYMMKPLLSALRGK